MAFTLDGPHEYREHRKEQADRDELHSLRTERLPLMNDLRPLRVRIRVFDDDSLGRLIVETPDWEFVRLRILLDPSIEVENVLFVCVGIRYVRQSTSRSLAVVYRYRNDSYEKPEDVDSHQDRGDT